MDDICNRIDVLEGEADREALKQGAVLKGVSYYPKPHNNNRAFAHYFDEDRREILSYNYIVQKCTRQARRQWADIYYLELEIKELRR